LDPHSHLEAVGLLRYSDNYRLVVELDPVAGLADFYRSMIPKCYKVQKPRWAAHITVVRSEKETPFLTEHWGKYEDEEITFCYDPKVNIDPKYCWLNVWCDRLSEIRTELGLPPKSRWTRPPSGGHHECFHITVANKKFESK
jgi:hypothetical protein